MSFKKKINVFRLFLMESLTKGIGNSEHEPSVDPGENVEIKKILISRPNHRLGNLLLITPLLQEINSTLPKCEIDLFIKGNLAPILFKDYNINKVIKLPKKHFNELLKYIYGWVSIKKVRYDLVINIDENSSSGKLSTQLARAKYKIFGVATNSDEFEYEDYIHIAKKPIYDFRRYLTKLGFSIDVAKTIPSLDIKLSAAEKLKGLNLLKDIVKNDKKTISVFTFATGNKCYSKSWWKGIYEKLKEHYQDYNIIEVLPIEKVSQIDFKAPTYYGKDVREIAALISNTKVFIGADSGIMHLSSSSGAPTIGLFSVTTQKKYEPYGNNSMALNTNVMEFSDLKKAIDNALKS